MSHGGAKFPELIVVLTGYGVTVYLHGETFINKAGITSSTFRTIPDVPVGVFELKLPEGPDSALAANGNLCTSTLTMPTASWAQTVRVITTVHPDHRPRVSQEKDGQEEDNKARPKHTRRRNEHAHQGKGAVKWGDAKRTDPVS